MTTVFEREIERGTGVRYAEKIVKHVNIIVFDDFMALDAFGPAEVFAESDAEYDIRYYSAAGGPITCSIQNTIETEKTDAIQQKDILLIPGGKGTRQLVDNEDFIKKLTTLAEESKYVLCVCTGSGLLSKTGLLDGRKATSNKKAWEWVTAQNTNVHWIKKARWVVDGKYYTSSGITAGIDMCLGFISDTIHRDAAKKIGCALEYVWNENKNIDPFY